MKSVVIIIICLAFLAGCNVMDSSGTEDFKLLAEEPASIIIEVLKVEATLMENGKEVIVADCWEDIDILNDAEINKMVHYVAMNIDATLTNIFFHTGEITLTAIEIPYTCKIPSGKLHINLPVMSYIFISTFDVLANPYLMVNLPFVGLGYGILIKNRFISSGFSLIATIFIVS